ncbi:2-oxoadipate dioxygenase/decarboxylase HglS [Lichenicoccus sp.]|uniref:2-oxoadipate dioxygenase/decarboxylase HglS n=1 Tax=Lichenicoccus sp. TaxID=2781899 RepID=UPI003D0DD5A9
MAVVDPDFRRQRFSQAMSAMYRREVPRYGDLIELVSAINSRVLDGDPALADSFDEAERARLDQERHGAIRVGTPEELGLLRRMFAVLGMVPVGYYDLAAAGVPVHATAFRATEPSSLAASPFRVFTSLLRLELIADAALRQAAQEILARRRIVTPRALALIERFEHAGGLDAPESQEFVREALETFRWHATATVDAATYDALRQAHPLLADVVWFGGPHINHLTPRVLDIDAAQAAMLARGLPAKEQIEGPPPRSCPVLLRQTSFKALSEPVRFGGSVGTHTARFGEIEQRGVALTEAGRARYDSWLASDKSHIMSSLPDNHAALREQDLAFYRYRRTGRPAPRGADLETALAHGAVAAEPILYEDFLPVSAAGIFRSNLGDSAREADQPAPRREALEAALGCAIVDEVALYRHQSQASAAACLG